MINKILYLLKLYKFNNLNEKILSGGSIRAFDDIQKEKKKGIYRTKYLDKNDLDKKNNPKIKFKYYYILNNNLVSDNDLDRIYKLGLAPAYDKVWVSSDPESKIQATGIDAKGRKQYRYHEKYIKGSNVKKFLRLYKFIKAVPKLDKNIEKDIKGSTQSKNYVIALMIYIVRETNIRVGKEYYARTNKSYGISSLKKSHIKIDAVKNRVKFNFKAKSNKQVQYTIDNPLIVKELKNIIKIDGEKLFLYKSETNGNYNRVSDVDLNKYIQDKMGKQFTMKDFRTYAANYYFIKALLKETRNKNPINQKIAKKNISNAQQITAYYLRHTKSISKKSYTMELIREKYMNDSNYFIENKNKSPLTILINILKLYKKNLQKK